MGSSSSMIRIIAMAGHTPVILDENNIPSPCTDATHWERGIRIPEDSLEAILRAEQPVMRTNPSPGKQCHRVSDAPAQPQGPLLAFQSSPSSISSIDCVSAATKASG